VLGEQLCSPSTVGGYGLDPHKGVPARTRFIGNGRVFLAEGTADDVVARAPVSPAMRTHPHVLLVAKPPSSRRALRWRKKELVDGTVR